MPPAPLRMGLRIPRIRQAMRDCIVQHGAGLTQLEVEAAREGRLAIQAARAARETKQLMEALEDGLRLLDYIEQGGS